MAGLLMFCLVSFVPLPALAQWVAPVVKVTSEEREQTYTSDGWAKIYYQYDGTIYVDTYAGGNYDWFKGTWTQAGATNLNYVETTRAGDTTYYSTSSERATNLVFSEHR
jgi:hypothetical protein